MSFTSIILLESCQSGPPRATNGTPAKTTWSVQLRALGVTTFAGTPVAIAADGSKQRIYVNLGTQGGVVVLDAGTRKIIRSIDSITEGPIALGPGDVLFGASSDGLTLLGVDSESEEIVGRVAFEGLCCLSANLAIGRLYAANAIEGESLKMAVIDAATYRIVKVIDPLPTVPVAIASDSADSRAYVVMQGLGRSSAIIWMVDGGTGDVLNRFNVELGTRGLSPEAMVVDPVTHRIYVLMSDSSTRRGAIVVLDGRTGVVVETKATPTSGSAMELDRTRHKLYVTSRDEQSPVLWVFDAATTRLESTIAADGLPDLVALDEATKRLYVTDVRHNSLNIFELVAR